MGHDQEAMRSRTGWYVQSVQSVPGNKLTFSETARPAGDGSSNVTKKSQSVVIVERAQGIANPAMGSSSAINRMHR